MFDEAGVLAELDRLAAEFATNEQKLGVALVNMEIEAGNAEADLARVTAERDAGVTKRDKLSNELRAVRAERDSMLANADSRVTEMQEKLRQADGALADTKHGARLNEYALAGKLMGVRKVLGRLNDENDALYGAGTVELAEAILSMLGTPGAPETVVSVSDWQKLRAERDLIEQQRDQLYIALSNLARVGHDIAYASAEASRVIAVVNGVIADTSQPTPTFSQQWEKARDEEGAGTPDDGAPKVPIPPDEAYRDRNGRIWVASGGGSAGDRKLHLAGWLHGIDPVDMDQMTLLIDPGKELEACRYWVCEPAKDLRAKLKTVSREWSRFQTIVLAAKAWAAPYEGKLLSPDYYSAEEIALVAALAGLESTPDGEAKIAKQDIHAAIDAWHNVPTEMTLHEFLGMTSDQYQFWLRNGTLPEGSPFAAEEVGPGPTGCCAECGQPDGEGHTPGCSVPKLHPKAAPSSERSELVRPRYPHGESQPMVGEPVVFTAREQAGIDGVLSIFQKLIDGGPEQTAPGGAKTPFDYPSCQAKVWDGPYQMTCGRLMPKGECITHGKPRPPAASPLPAADASEEPPPILFAPPIGDNLAKAMGDYARQENAAGTGEVTHGQL